MAYTIEKLQKAVDTLSKPSEHIKCVRQEGEDYLCYSSDLVRAFEVAIEVMKEKLTK